MPFPDRVTGWHDPRAKRHPVEIWGRHAPAKTCVDLLGGVPDLPALHVAVIDLGGGYDTKIVGQYGCRQAIDSKMDRVAGSRVNKAGRRRLDAEPVVDESEAATVAIGQRQEIGGRLAFFEGPLAAFDVNGFLSAH